VSLPRDPVELIARVASAAQSEWDEIEVSLDGRALGRWLPAGSGYQDYAVQIPSDPSRPRVSTVTFHFVASAPVTAGVRFDRISFAQ
jgi:hypothetical protein